MCQNEDWRAGRALPLSKVNLSAVHALDRVPKRAGRRPPPGPATAGSEGESRISRELSGVTATDAVDAAGIEGVVPAARAGAVRCLD
jgi:hypothetical protein